MKSDIENFKNVFQIEGDGGHKCSGECKSVNGNVHHDESTISNLETKPAGRI